MLTCCDYHTKQTTDNLIHLSVELLVGCFGAIHRPVCVIAHTQAKQIRLADDKVEVLIENLRDMFRCATTDSLVCKLF